MSALREGYEPPPREARREAYMRHSIRKVRREGHENIAVVCGAWHAPALHLEDHRVKADDALLKGLKRTKTSATWIPWTNGRLSYRSGYGAGIASPATTSTSGFPPTESSPPAGSPASPDCCAPKTSTPHLPTSSRPPGWRTLWPPSETSPASTSCVRPHWRRYARERRRSLP